MAIATPIPSTPQSLLTLDERATACILTLVDIIRTARANKAIADAALVAVQNQLVYQQQLSAGLQSELESANTAIAGETAQIIALQQAVADSTNTANNALAQLAACQVDDPADDAALEAALAAAMEITNPPVVDPIVDPAIDPITDPSIDPAIDPEMPSIPAGEEGIPLVSSEPDVTPVS
jgi:septal ring factor EnvC (AmiA/AmiB activator)